MTGRTRALVWLVASIAVIAFLESYQGLLHAAQAGGRPLPIVWPWAVEGFTLAMNLVIWDARARARRAGWAWTLLIAATTLSTTLQVLDALNQPPPHGHDALSGWQTGLRVLTGAWTPVALLLSFERCIWLLYATPRHDAQPAAHPDATPAADRPAQPVSTPAGSAMLQQPTARPASRPPAQPAQARGSSLPSAATRAGGSAPSDTDDRMLLEQAWALNAEALAARGRPISRDKLRAALGIGATRAERLLAALAHPPAIVDDQGGLMAPARAPLPAQPPSLPTSPAEAHASVGADALPAAPSTSTGNGHADPPPAVLGPFLSHPEGMGGDV